MWGPEKNYQGREFLTPPAKWKHGRDFSAMPISERRPRRSPQPRGDAFHVIHKVPAGDSPYVKAKHVQLIEKDPSRAISLFWASINAGDRVESALKDMAVVMKQLNRSEEAIEAIKSFRHLCPNESQDSLDNVLLELYKSSGRIQDEIELLQLKLKHIEEDMAFGGKQSKIARSQGRKVQVTVEKEYSRLLGNLAWVFMQQKDYKSAEEFYRKALSLEPDKNKQCNLAICLIHMDKIVEARFLLRTVQFSADCSADESYVKSFERAVQMIDEIESQSTGARIPRNKYLCCNTTGSAVSDSLGNKKAVAYESSPSILTQPRRRQALQWSSASNHGGEVQTNSNTTGRWLKQTGDHFSRELLFEQPLVPLEPLPLGGGGPDCPQGPSTVRISLELREIVQNSMENLKAVQHLDESPKQAPHIILEREGSKKSWADMVEEDDEQEKEQCVEKIYQRMPRGYPQEIYSFCRTPNNFSECCKDQQFNNENADNNVTVDPDPSVNHNEPKKKDSERPESSPVDDPEYGGYYTQPANVRRSLTFHDQQQPNAADNRGDSSSPLVQDTFNVDTYASVLTGRGCSNSLKGVVGVKRLKVFRDITPDSPRAS